MAAIRKEWSCLAACDASSSRSRCASAVAASRSPSSRLILSCSARSAASTALLLPAPTAAEADEYIEKDAPAGGATAPPAPLALRVLVGPGDVTVYSTNVQHRGGANTGSRSRPTFHLAVIGDGAAPTGIPYTVLTKDVIGLYPRTDPTVKWIGDD